MISQTAEYALRAMMCLASHKGASLTTQEVAAATKVPAGYLSKVLQALGRAGLIRSQRGLHGGSTLARPANEITVLEVVNAVDPVKRIRRCPLGLSAHGNRLCALHRRLDEAACMVEKAFADSTMEELLEPTAGSRRACRGPVLAEP